MFTSLDLANHFGFKILNGDLKALHREITVQELDRPGLQLLGMFSFHQDDRIMLIGNKEIGLIKDNDADFIYKNCLKLCSKKAPAIIICQNEPCPEPLLRAAKKNNFPIFQTASETTDMMSSIYIYLNEALAPKTSVHGCLLDVFGIGILLLGESGIGKSEVSLDLIKKGHRIIADDRVNIASVRGNLVGTCPDQIAGMMEVRGIGIIDVARMFGINALEKKVNISLAISLVKFEKGYHTDRLGMKTERYEILSSTIPLVKLPVSPGRSMSEIIETAVTNFKLKDSGYDTAYEFQKRLEEIQTQKKEKEKNLKLIKEKNND